jgi:hypothetical protein
MESSGNRRAAAVAGMDVVDILASSLLLGLPAPWSCYGLTVATDGNARSSPLIVRAWPVTVKVALERRSSELLPALSSTGPGSMTSSPDSPV